MEIVEKVQETSWDTNCITLCFCAITILHEQSMCLECQECRNRGATGARAPLFSSDVCLSVPPTHRDWANAELELGKCPASHKQCFSQIGEMLRKGLPNHQDIIHWFGIQFDHTF